MQPGMGILEMVVMGIRMLFRIRSGSLQSATLALGWPEASWTAFVNTGCPRRGLQFEISPLCKAAAPRTAVPRLRVPPFRLPHPEGTSEPADPGTWPADERRGQAVHPRHNESQVAENRQSFSQTPGGLWISDAAQAVPRSRAESERLIGLTSSGFDYMGPAPCIQARIAVTARSCPPVNCAEEPLSGGLVRIHWSIGSGLVLFRR